MTFAGEVTPSTGGVLSTENHRTADCDTWPTESLQYTTIWCPPSGIGTRVVFVVKRTFEPPSTLYQLVSTVALNCTVKGMPVPLAYVIFAGVESVIVIAPDPRMVPSIDIWLIGLVLPAVPRMAESPAHCNTVIVRNTMEMDNTRTCGEKGHFPVLF